MNRDVVLGFHSSALRFLEGSRFNATWIRWRGRSRWWL